VLALRENIALRLTPTLPEMKTATPAYLSQDCVYKLFLYQQTAVFDFRTGPCRRALIPNYAHKKSHSAG
jgi:hypothetical protein